MPGALTWDPTPPGGSQSTSRGGVNPSADGASFSPAEVAGLKGVVSADGISPDPTSLQRLFADGAPAGAGFSVGPLSPWNAALTAPGCTRNLSVWATAVAAGTAKFALWGTSISNGRNQNFYGSTLYRMLRWAMRRAFPTLTLSSENFGIGGATAAQALSFVSTTNFSFTAPAQTQYREEWQAVTATTASKAWKTYIQDFGPDMLFVEFGLNDTNTATYAASVQAIIDDVRSGGSWSVKRPSIVLVSTHTGVDPSDIYYQNFRALRALAMKNGCPILDANRFYEIMVTGRDPESFPAVTGEWVGLQYMANAGSPAAFDPAYWQYVTGVPYTSSGTTWRDQTAGSNPVKTLRKRSTTDGAVQGRGTTSASTGVLSLWYRADPADANFGTDTGKTYEVRLSGTTVQAYYRSSGGSLTAISGSSITLSPGAGTNTPFTVRVDYSGAWHRITVYEGTASPQVVEFFDFQYMGAGYAGYGVSGTGGGFFAIGAIGNQTSGCVLEYWDQPPSYGLCATDAVLVNTVNDFGTNPASYGGNGNNHLTGPAHVAVYQAAIGVVMRQLQDAA